MAKTTAWTTATVNLLPPLGKLRSTPGVKRTKRATRYKEVTRFADILYSFIRFFIE